MQIGAESRNKIIVLAVLLLVAAFLFPRIFSGKPAQPVTVAAPAKPARKGAVARTTGKKLLQRKGTVITSLDPTLRFDWLRSSEDQEYTGGKRNIFEPRSEEMPRPIDDGTKSAHIAPPPPLLPPGPPPIPIKFFGFATEQGTAKRVFLSNGDDVLIGKEGEIIARRYRIVKINGNSVEIEDVLNNNKQVIPLSQG